MKDAQGLWALLCLCSVGMCQHDWLGAAADSTSLGRCGSSNLERLHWTGKLVDTTAVSAVTVLAVQQESRVAAGYSGGEVRAWDARSGDRILAKDDGDSVSSLSFHPDLPHVAWAGRRRTIQIFDLDKAESLTAMYLGSHPPKLRFTPDGQELFGAHSGYSGMWILPADSLHVLSQFGGGLDRVRCATWSADARRVAFGSLHSEINVHMCRDWAGERRINDRRDPGHTHDWNGVHQLALGPEGEVFAGCGDGHIRAFRSEGIEPLWTVASGYYEHLGLALVSSSEELLCLGQTDPGDGASVLRLLRVSDGSLIDELPLPEAATALEVSGATIWVGTVSGAVLRYSLQD